MLLLWFQVTLQGLPKKPEDHDDYQKNRGPITKFHSEFGCIQDVVSFSANDDNLGDHLNSNILIVK